MKIYIYTLLTILVLSFVGFGQGFSPEWKTVPTNFNGHDFEAIYGYLLRNRPEMGKDEFETTAQYQARIADLSKIPLGNGLTAKDALVFVYRPSEDKYNLSLFGLQSTYNADEAILDIQIRTRSFKAVDWSLREGRDTIVTFAGTYAKPSTFKSEGTYIGENSYGVKAEITKYSNRSYYLAIANINRFNESSGGNIFLKLPMPAEKAKLAKPHLAVLFSTNLIKPYFTVDITEIKPTISSPREVNSYDNILIGNVNHIWIFNNITGEIYAKLKPVPESRLNGNAPSQ